MRLKENYKLYLEDQIRIRTQELEASRNAAEGLGWEIVERLTAIAEFRDTEAGAHLARIGIFYKMLAMEMGLPAETIKQIVHSSPLHDIGKIGVTEYILTDEAGASFSESIVLNHHERWDRVSWWIEEGPHSHRRQDSDD